LETPQNRDGDGVFNDRDDEFSELSAQGGQGGGGQGGGGQQGGSRAGGGQGGGGQQGIGRSWRR